MAKQRRPLPKPTKAPSPSPVRPARPTSVNADAPASPQARASSSAPLRRSTYVEAVTIYERGLETLQRQHSDAIDAGDFLTVHYSNVQFHRTLFSLCGNLCLIETIENLAQTVLSIRS